MRSEIEELEVSEPGGARVAARRQSLTTLEAEWESETERVRRHLAARDQLHTEGVRILTAMGRGENSIRQWVHAGRAGPHPHRAPRDLAAAVVATVAGARNDTFSSAAAILDFCDDHRDGHASENRRADRAFR